MFSNCEQIGVVEAEIDRAMKNLREIFGVGPFRIIEWPPTDRQDFERYYYGEPRDFTARMAFTEVGMMGMVFDQHNKGPDCARVRPGLTLTRKILLVSPSKL